MRNLGESTYGTLDVAARMGEREVFASDLLEEREDSTLGLGTELVQGGAGLAVAENKNGEGHGGSG
jgi:hypothetical protein